MAGEPECWWYPVRVAASASWRLVTAIAVVAVLPVGSLAVLFMAMDLWAVAPLWLLASTVAFALSYFVHELAHAVTHWVIARRTGRSAEMIADGSFGHARIIRWSLGVDADAVTALAGPLVAVLAGIPFLVTPAPYIATFPLFALFLVHVASLHPGHADGAQLFAVIRPGVRDADGV